jgi:tetratricopeptide (TPR) repeat protein
MKEERSRWLKTIFPMAIILSFTHIAQAQVIGPATRPVVTVFHRVEGRVRQRNTSVANIRVRLVRVPQMQPIADSFTSPDGQFVFQRVPTGDYMVETFETDVYEATETNVSVYPRDLMEPRPTSANLFIDLPLKAGPDRVPPGELMADVDLHVPRKALKHYQAGMQKLGKGESVEGIVELQTAIEIFPPYYAARLELGRELRLRKRFSEALETIQPLLELAPKRTDPRIEKGILLLALERRDEAVHELEAALRLEEVSWAAHLYLGWALLEQDESRAEPHFQRAIEIDEHKAARAHLALARIAETRGNRGVALAHLDAYLALAPNAADAEATRQLAIRLRSKN